jgi:Protein of unknown function (DUF3489)
MAKSKRAHRAKTASGSKLRRKTANTKKAGQSKTRSAPPRAQRTDSKQAQVIKMLRAPSGTTVTAMMTATGWQQHSVHGFLAGVIRKKFGLNLVSEAGDGGRVYRIKDGKARAQPSTQQAA